jgi:beta-glucosidase
MLVDPTSDDTINVTVSVTNTGSVAGRATLGLYYSIDVSRFVRFHKMLAGFAKTAEPLPPGTTSTIEISVSALNLATWDPMKKDYIIEVGEYRLIVGEDSATENIVAPLTIA